MKSFAFALAGDKTETLELDVYSVIGESFWFDSVSAKAVRRRLKENAGAKLIKTRIHSDGGDTFEAAAIYADLQAHGARIEVDITGIAASAATFIAMAGDRIRIAEAGFFMIHNVWGCACGSPEDLESWAEVMRKTSANFADIYAKRSGLDRKKVAALMDEETWMTAAEAKAFGFVDEVIPATAKAAASAGDKRALDAVRRSVAFSFASGDYSNVPELLKTQLSTLDERPRARVGEAIKSFQANLPLGPLPEPQEKPDMTIPKSIYAALNLQDGSDEETVVKAVKRSQARLTVLASIVALVGLKPEQSEEEAVGTIRAWKESAAKLPAAQAELAKTKTDSEKTELEQLLAKGREDKKLTKADADKLAERVDGYNKAKAENREPTEEEWSLSQVRAYVKALPANPMLAGAGAPPAGSGAPPPQGSAIANTWEGKTYEQLSGPEASALEQSDPDLFRQMRADWVKRGEPEFKPADKTKAA